MLGTASLCGVQSRLRAFPCFGLKRSSSFLRPWGPGKLPASKIKQSSSSQGWALELPKGCLRETKTPRAWHSKPPGAMTFQHPHTRPRAALSPRCRGPWGPQSQQPLRAQALGPPGPIPAVLLTSCRSLHVKKILIQLHP